MVAWVSEPRSLILLVCLHELLVVAEILLEANNLEEDADKWINSLVAYGLSWPC